MAIKVGDKIPFFNAKDLNGNEFNSAYFIGKKAVVYYFYPKDNTPGCTREACDFRDSYEDFKDLGAEVVGISKDSVTSHKEFAMQYRLPFLLLSDSKNEIRKLFGVPKDFLGLLPGRTTYVTNKEGIVIFVFDSISGSKHISKALDAIKKII
ncbi:MAG: peroxiredoxin [Flavobacterium sp.]